MHANISLDKKACSLRMYQFHILSWIMIPFILISNRIHNQLIHCVMFIVRVFTFVLFNFSTIHCQKR